MEYKGHTCECGSTEGVTKMWGPVPLMSWCKKCGKAYDPLNGFVRVPDEDKSPDDMKRYITDLAWMPDEGRGQ